MTTSLLLRLLENMTNSDYTNIEEKVWVRGDIINNVMSSKLNL